MSRDQVFISYSHKDKGWLDKLKTHLTPLQRDGTVSVWDDTIIKPGEIWKEEIKKALARAKVAVLLVSPDFLASKFIAEDELPPLLAASEKEGLAILWVPVRSSHYTRTVIAKYQAAHDPAKPLSGMNRARQDSALVEIVKKIEAVAPPLSPPLQYPSVVSTPPALSIPPPHISTAPYIHSWSTSEVQTLQRRTAEALKLPTEFRDFLKNGGEGPMMVVIPGGRFLMGSPPDEPERRNDERQHEVEVAPFALGKFAVTFEEYDRFAAEAKHYKPNEHIWSRGRQPVINVKRIDAVDYANWLSEKTGQTYRLPTEAEWEYACRAGTITPFYFGTTISTEQANYKGHEAYAYSGGREGLYRERPIEVGQFPANNWGLHDMHGNVWEWTGSEYDKYYKGAELCIASNLNRGFGVLRGGSWSSPPEHFRSAARNLNNPEYCGGCDVGFRLARTLTL